MVVEAKNRLNGLLYAIDKICGTQQGSPAKRLSNMLLQIFNNRSLPRLLKANISEQPQIYVDSAVRSALNIHLRD